MSSRNIGPVTGRAEAEVNGGSLGVTIGVANVASQGGGVGPMVIQAAVQDSGGPSGGAARGYERRLLTEQDLPPPDTKRWVMRRKADVVAGVRCGLISLDEACRRYTLSVEEFLSWQRLIDSHGVRGLRATRLQDYRGGGAEEALAE